MYKRQYRDNKAHPLSESIRAEMIIYNNIIVDFQLHVLCCTDNTELV